MSKKLIALMTACFAFACLAVLPASADHHEPKHKIKDVMKKAFKGGLVKKVQKGDASDEEKKTLHELLVSLSKNKPPKGEAESWKKLTTALVKAGKAAVDGDEKASDMLQAAAKCAACHKVHKP